MGDRVISGQERHELGHVALGLARGAGDGLERLARQLGIHGGDPLAGAGLHGHDADGVGSAELVDEVGDRRDHA